MGTVIIVLVIVALVAGVVLNKRAAAGAAEGVEFTVDATPDAVSDAIRATYCSGAKAAAKSIFTGISVSQSAPRTFEIASKLGDSARIDIQRAGAGNTLVRARTESLYVGSHPSSHFRNGLLAIGAVITHRIFTLLGIAPGASRMNRVQRGIEPRIVRELQRSSRG